MPRLGSTISRLVEGQRNFANLAKLAQNAVGHVVGAETPSRLVAVENFGSNPGALDMLVYAPQRLAPKPALMVVLHGCTQDAAGYDRGSGWSTLADRHGFVLVYPQQRTANNPKSCFNWFQPADIGRDSGEALSIRQMVEHAVHHHGVDPSRVFVTGLSAGGAMTAVMLATYPEVFAGGAVIAGLPYGGARTVSDALGSMFQGRSHEAAEWGDLVRSASPYRGPWPTLSVWHGSADATVKPDNADQLVKQWTNLHGVALAAGEAGTLEGQAHRVWKDATGRVIVESTLVAGMGHGTPLAVEPGSGETAGPFMLDVGISSSRHIARFFGLTEAEVRQPAPSDQTVAGQTVVKAPGNGAPRTAPAETTLSPSTPSNRRGSSKPAAPVGFDIAGTINSALRTAGLLK